MIKPIGALALVSCVMMMIDYVLCGVGTVVARFCTALRDGLVLPKMQESFFLFQL